jgi:hypothetical protein
MRNASCLAITLACLSSIVVSFGAEAPRRYVEGIRDNSFFIEEAYNQEPGVVQHIFNGLYAIDKLDGPDDKGLALLFTQEWPVFSQKHQFSYTVPYAFLETGGQSDNGVGDVFLNYRYQAVFEEETLLALAPRFSLILPTGDVSENFGNDSLGYQWNLPFSRALGDRWYVHANAGLIFLPDAGDPEHDLLHYNIGGSAIYALSPDFHLMLEWVGLWLEEHDSAGAGHHEFSSLISPGARRAFNFENGSQLVVGLGVPIGLTGSAQDVGVFMYLSFEHAFMKNK